MAEYKLEVTTGERFLSGTNDHVYVTIFGTGGQSERTELDNFGFDHTGTYTLSTNLSLGKLLLIKVEKSRFCYLPEDEWYLSKIVVTTPEGEAILFPYYRWISRGELVELRGGKGLFQIYRYTYIILYIIFAILPEYVSEHWKEDDFYGFQFLNGLNPKVIKRCSELPPNFPVTEEMVKPFLEEGSSLQEEVKIISALGDGFVCLSSQYNFALIYLCNSVLCLSFPYRKNPIFLPSDSETDWLLAKMFIKNVDSMDHEAVQHLMKTHFLAEVYTVAALRSFSGIHPLYKLLIPHFQYTLFINTDGRPTLFGPDGSSLGYDGLTELMRRALSETTYSSLCLPEDITARGLESIPNFYYRDDGLKLWDIINSFVKAVVEYYYPSDSEVRKDNELQEWISEIFTHGFLGNKASGFPESFHTVEEVIKFITMVIFTVTVQHAAVNNGQFDYYSCVPNISLLLRKPPPTTKGQSSMETILETLPNVGETVNFEAMVCLLSETYSDMVPMGSYPDERFQEPAPKQMIKEFQAELSNFSEAIATRNLLLKIPYSYLDPAHIENSIAI
uniref:Uncharacterized protein n=1 Tax=Cyclopterus lumpus TaxID=8103 RepID=A0A8C2ZFX0_CYCLU